MQFQNNEITEEVESAHSVVADKKRFLVGLVGLGLIIVGVVGINWLQPSASVPLQTIQASEKPISSLEPVATEARKAVFTILNGSGVAGAAGKLSNRIKEAGYDVVNTSNYDKVIEGNIIEINENVEERDKVVEILKRLGVDGEIQKLEGDLEYSVKVVIGK